MVNRYPYRILLFSVFLLLLQGFILGTLLPIHEIVTVYIYWMPILFFSIATSTWRMMIIGSLLGLFMDWMHDSWGLFLMAGLWVGVMRNFLLRFFFTPRKLKINKEKSIGRQIFSFASFVFFCFCLASIHSLILIVFEWLTVMLNYYLLIKWLLDTIYSTFTLVIFYTLFQKLIDKKYA